MFRCFLNHFALAILAVSLLASSCEQNRPKGEPLSQEDLINKNKERLSREDQFIDAWLENKEWNIKTTTTGLRYYVYSDSAGDRLQSEDIAIVTFKLFLLDSSLVASEISEKPLAFRVDRDDVVSGLHEAIKLLSPGDSAILILPSYLGYGLTGATDIPSNMPLLYDIQVLDKR